MSKLARNALEKYFNWWHDTERRRKSLPYLPGQEVQWEGKMWLFQARADVSQYLTAWRTSAVRNRLCEQRSRQSA